MSSQRRAWVLVLVCFLINTILFQVVVHTHVSQQHDESSLIRNTVVVSKNRPKRSLRDNVVVVAKKLVPTDQVLNKVKDKVDLDKFVVPEKLIADRSSSEKDMGTEALERFMLLWRGIAAFVAFPEYQSDPDKSWRLIEEELKMLQDMGVNVLNPIIKIRSGEMNAVHLMESVPKKDRNAASAIVSFLYRAIKNTKSDTNDDDEKYQVERIDSMMLFKNLLSNKWRRRQEEAREEYFKEFHQKIQDQYGKMPGISDDVSIVSKYFTPL
jgi:hypothetical protein